MVKLHGHLAICYISPDESSSGTDVLFYLIYISRFLKKKFIYSLIEFLIVLIKYARFEVSIFTKSLNVAEMISFWVGNVSFAVLYKSG